MYTYYSMGTIKRLANQSIVSGAFLQRYKWPKTRYQSLRQTMASTVRQERQLLEGHETNFALLNTCSEGALVAGIAR